MHTHTHFITVAKPTANHGHSLKRLGYEVQETSERFLITASGSVETLDISEGLEPLRVLIKEKKLLTYASKITVLKDGEKKVVYGVMGCNSFAAAAKALGFPLNASCLIAHEVGGKGKAAAEAAAAVETLDLATWLAD